MLSQPFNGTPTNIIILHRVFRRSFLKRAEEKVTFCFNMVEKFQMHDSKLEQDFCQKLSKNIRQRIFPSPGKKKRRLKKQKKEKKKEYLYPTVSQYKGIN